MTSSGLLVHLFTSSDLANVHFPTVMNNPFHYTPHPLCLTAQKYVMQQIESQEALKNWFCQGKMLGVLVVALDVAAGESGQNSIQPERSTRNVGFLAAYSGNFEVGGADFFVPPVFDLNQLHSFYTTKDRDISALNQRIADLQDDEKLKQLCKVLESLKLRSETEIEAYKREMQASKEARNRLRAQENLTDDDLSCLLAESQFQKAELKRKKNAFSADIQRVESEIKSFNEKILRLKQERKERSTALQREIFEHFVFHNARGETQNVVDIFSKHSRAAIPPAGAGECAGPRLLEYAYRHGLKPLAMAEFWYGRPTADNNRKHGCCYPACQEKCAPIFSFMLQGLAVEGVASPTLPSVAHEPLDVLYEDDEMLVVNKPGGVLSVPGRGAHPYVTQMLLSTHPDAGNYLPAHRLDMDTSGLLLIAKNEAMHRALQHLFIGRKVEKEYEAWLDGTILAQSGVIRLPLAPDHYHRPKQRVDHAEGKNAVTYFRVMCTTETRTLVRFMPLTGRTHQLRVHSAAPEGLGVPIVGDPLYGHKDWTTVDVNNNSGAQDTRLCLHACSLKFVHPKTGAQISVRKNLW